MGTLSISLVCIVTIFGWSQPFISGVSRYGIAHFEISPPSASENVSVVNPPQYVNWINNIYGSALDEEAIHRLGVTDRHARCWRECTFRFRGDGLYSREVTTGGERKANYDAERGSGAKIFDLYFHRNAVIPKQTSSGLNKKVRPQLMLAGFSRLTPLSDGGCRDYRSDRANIPFKKIADHPTIVAQRSQNLSEQKQRGLISFLIFVVGSAAVILLRKY
jgi:hypothetical protein